MSGRPAVYLAGPDVFLPDARAVGAAKQAICAQVGLDGRFPLDAELPHDLDRHPPAEQARHIREACVAMMDRCGAALANLTPFRGVSADVGTAFEVGYLTARGAPVIGYTSAVEDYGTRVRDAGRADGMEVEDFGLVDNLMLGGVSGVVAVAGGGPDALAAFELAAAQLADLLGPWRS